MEPGIQVTVNRLSEHSSSYGLTVPGCLDETGGNRWISTTTDVSFLSHVGSPNSQGVWLNVNRDGVFLSIGSIVRPITATADLFIYPADALAPFDILEAACSDESIVKKFMDLVQGGKIVLRAPGPAPFLPDEVDFNHPLPDIGHIG